jgi:hypothetical protein
MLTLMVLFSCSAAMAQSNAEAEIRNLDQQELQAVFKRDTTALSKIWAPEFLVNNPSNQIFTRKQVANLIATGKIDYSSFDRKIERVSIIDNTAIVMGGEVVKPKGLATNAGKTVVRRFTNIWMKRDNVWKLVGRQATIVSIQ